MKYFKKVPVQVLAIRSITTVNAQTKATTNEHKSYKPQLTNIKN